MGNYIKYAKWEEKQVGWNKTAQMIGWNREGTEYLWTCFGCRSDGLFCVDKIRGVWGSKSKHQPRSQRIRPRGDDSSSCGSTLVPAFSPSPIRYKFAYMHMQISRFTNSSEFGTTSYFLFPSLLLALLVIFFYAISASWEKQTIMTGDRGENVLHSSSERVQIWSKQSLDR